MTPIDDIKQRLDLVDLIQGYTKLTQAGSNWKARCPFHTEKSPSFMVSRDKQIWHCFGCGKGGDAFSFVKEIEGMEFPEALRFLAEKTGVELKREDPKLRTERTRAFDVNAFAAKVYHRILLEHEKAAEARAYLTKRGVSDAIIREWQLGYAPESWEGVSQFLKKHDFSDQDIFQAGLTVKRERGSGYYDRFRHRIMFPIHDHLGRPVGFGGRALEANQTPKYLNTPQTSVYDKRALLYGLHRAKNAIKTEKRAVVVEGYMDVLASHQAGVTNVVASSGTALTREQVRQVKRLTNDLALAFDTDVAGQSASLRGIEIAWEEEMNVRVIHVPAGKDPDELIRSDVNAWKNVVASAQPFMEYLFARAKERFDLTTVEGKKAAAKLLLPMISKLKDPIEQTHYLQELSVLIRVAEELLRERLPRQPFQGKKEERLVVTKTPLAPSRAQRVAERLLGLAVHDTAHLEYLIDHLQPELFAPTTLLGLYKALITYYTENHHLDQREFLQALGREDPELAKAATIVFLFGTSDLLPQNEKLQKQEVLEGIAVLERLALHEELKHLQTDVAEAERQAMTDRLRVLTERVHEITRRLAELE